MRETLDGQLISNANPVNEGYFSVNDLADKYGYAKDYIGWLARTGRIQAVRYGKHGRWYASEEALLNYRQSLIDKPRAFTSTNSAVPFSVLSNRVPHEWATEFPKSGRCPTLRMPHSRNESSYSAKQPRKTALSSRGELRRNNAIPRKFLLLVGGILFLSVYVRPYLSENGPWLARAAIGDQAYADMVNFFRNTVRLFTEDATAQVYDIVVEKGVIKATRMIAGKELCVDDVCITKEQLRALLEERSGAVLFNE